MSLKRSDTNPFSVASNTVQGYLPVMRKNGDERKKISMLSQVVLHLYKSARISNWFVISTCVCTVMAVSPSQFVQWKTIESNRFGTTQNESHVTVFDMTFFCKRMDVVTQKT
eukprot:gb/GEZJ01005399.1/.p1 GENE.gb/GEZJ01005399.1/~~gb/GEZJ01005399.1/.p1  ORF type:complete len:112 (-),score=10.65 gb/GEZJ01005399.1/:74-409(-)